MSDTRKLLTITEAMRIWGVSRRTLYNWMEAGRLEFTRTPSGTPRIYADALTKGTIPKKYVTKPKGTPPFRVKLEIFRTSGKWYTDGVYYSDCAPLFEIWAEVREMQKTRTLPGLISGHDAYIVRVDVPSHPHRHSTLLIPNES